MEDALEWAFRAQRVEAAVRGGAGLQRMEHEADGGVWLGASSDGIVALQRIAALGCRVDSSGMARAAIDRTPADALALHDAVQRLEPRARELVATHARQGTAPAWLLDGALKAVRRHEGRSDKVLVLEGEGRGPHCPVGWLNTEADLALLRSDWRCWFAGLQDVWFDLVQRAPADGGVSFDLLGPAAPMTPWEDERADEVVVSGRPGTVTPEMVERAREMHARGQGSWREIARQLGVSKDALARALPKAVHDLPARRRAVLARKGVDVSRNS